MTDYQVSQPVQIFYSAFIAKDAPWRNLVWSFISVAMFATGYLIASEPPDVEAIKVRREWVEKCANKRANMLISGVWVETTYTYNIKACRRVYKYLLD